MKCIFYTSEKLVWDTSGKKSHFFFVTAWELRNAPNNFQKRIQASDLRINKKKIWCIVSECSGPMHMVSVCSGPMHIFTARLFQV